MSTNRISAVSYARRPGSQKGVTRGRLGGAALVLTAMLAVPSVLSAGPAFAAPAGTQPRDRDGTQVVISGRIVVTEGETVGDVVILNGDASINGRVDGSVFALNGDVIVRGSVKDDVIATNGRVVAAGGARDRRRRRLP